MLVTRGLPGGVFISLEIDLHGDRLVIKSCTVLSGNRVGQDLITWIPAFFNSMQITFAGTR